MYFHYSDNKGIQALNLGDNNISSEGVKFLATVLKTENKSLKELDLKSNEIGKQ